MRRYLIEKTQRYTRGSAYGKRLSRAKRQALVPQAIEKLHRLRTTKRRLNAAWAAAQAAFPHLFTDEMLQRARDDE